MDKKLLRKPYRKSQNCMCPDTMNISVSHNKCFSSIQTSFDRLWHDLVLCSCNIIEYFVKHHTGMTVTSMTITMVTTIVAISKMKTHHVHSPSQGPKWNPGCWPVDPSGGEWTTRNPNNLHFTHIYATFHCVKYG